MKTPIVDFVKKYQSGANIRAHMPGHKGKAVFDVAKFDITEISGADSLYEAEGIIRESEAYASEIFGADTFYSAEGSTQCIKAMLFLAVKHARSLGKKPLVLAARNAHKSFIAASALLDFEIKWILPNSETYLSSAIDLEELEAILSGDDAPTALYLTSPDYLGAISDISAAAKICKKYGVLLLVDNAHGAYLKFLEKSRHPIDQGADMCCDSAHKTLSALTGAAYLHISRNAAGVLKETAKYALSIFGSTSPSYLILASLDALNPYLSGDYAKELQAFVAKFEKCKQKLSKIYRLTGEEPLKITISPKEHGYLGTELAEYIRAFGIEPEFSDPDYLVLMLTPENTEGEIERITEVLVSVPKKAAIKDGAPAPRIYERVLMPREALMADFVTVDVRESLGKVLASASVACPPAVPILVMGERIDKDAISAFLYYGIEKINVLRCENKDE